MQIGSRWPVGADAPTGLPEPFLAAVSAAEREHNLTSGAWTLTWLEGRPIAEHPTGVRIDLGDDASEFDDDDWLA